MKDIALITIPYGTVLAVPLRKLATLSSVLCAEGVELLTEKGYDSVRGESTYKPSDATLDMRFVRPNQIVRPEPEQTPEANPAPSDEDPLF